MSHDWNDALIPRCKRCGIAKACANYTCYSPDETIVRKMKMETKMKMKMKSPEPKQTQKQSTRAERAERAERIKKLLEQLFNTEVAHEAAKKEYQEALYQQNELSNKLYGIRKEIGKLVSPPIIDDEED